MADGLTTQLQITLPEVGASQDTWGTKLNGGLETIDDEIVRPRVQRQDLTIVGGTATLNLANGRAFSHTNSEVHTVAFSNIPPITLPGGQPAATRWWLAMTNAGAFAITWPASVAWDGGGAPSLPATGVSIIEFFTADGGITVHATVLKQPTLSTRPAASVYHASTQGTSTPDLVLAFNSERFDDGGMHDNAVNNSRLTVPAGQGGTYRLAFHATFHDNGSVTLATFRFRKNGTTDLRSTDVFDTHGSFNNKPIALECEEVLAAGDYVEVLASENGASTITIAGGLTLIGFEARRMA